MVYPHCHRIPRHHSPSLTPSSFNPPPASVAQRGTRVGGCLWPQALELFHRSAPQPHHGVEDAGPDQRPVGYGAPDGACPWSRQRKSRRLRRILDFIENLPAGEVAYYQDEVDIRLNPRIGRDWMLPGRQKVILTPGQNVKRYVAGALAADGAHSSS